MDNKISANDTIISILCNLNIDRVDNVYKAIESYMASIPSTGAVYPKLKHLLNQKPHRFLQINNLPNDLKKLIQQYDPNTDCVFLNNDIDWIISELLKEWNNKDAFNYHNIPVRNKILFYGPTGNGKTTIAKYISKVSCLPYVEVNSDIIIDSHLGNTGQNINKIFNQLNQPCILFWDEIDGIGKKRGTYKASSADSENERMTNSILTNIEKLNKDVIFIAATNRYDVLDDAFLRRFDLKFELKKPNEDQKQQFSRKIIEYYKLPDSFIDKDLTKFESYSELKFYYLDLARKYILSKIE
jgi:SpoVK/Ycf46/Vps4 family AAA+-type ATPase